MPWLGLWSVIVAFSCCTLFSLVFGALTVIHAVDIFSLPYFNIELFNIHNFSNICSEVFIMFVFNGFFMLISHTLQLTVLKTN